MMLHDGDTDQDNDINAKSDGNSNDWSDDDDSTDYSDNDSC